jgi:hypothetical protein
VGTSPSDGNGEKKIHFSIFPEIYKYKGCHNLLKKKNGQFGTGGRAQGLSRVSTISFLKELSTICFLKKEEWPVGGNSVSATMPRRGIREDERGNWRELVSCSP